MNEREVLHPETGELVLVRVACDMLAEAWMLLGAEHPTVKAWDANVNAAKRGEGPGTARV